MALLEVRNLVKDFDGVRANNNVSLETKEGEILGLIGPNGAGKTTLFNCIAGYHVPSSGKIYFKEQDITSWPPHRTNKAGIGRTFQVMRIMGRLSVEENVLVGAFSKIGDRREAREYARDILELVEMIDERDSYPPELPVASQRKVELARALATDPSLLMLDEVAAGLNPQETERMIAVIRKILSEKDITFFVIEHVMEFLMPISDRVIVLANGEKIAEGKPDQVAEEPEVIKAYLGEKYAERK